MGEWLWLESLLPTLSSRIVKGVFHGQLRPANLESFSLGEIKEVISHLQERLLALHSIIAAAGEHLTSLPSRPVRSHPSCSLSIEKHTSFEFLISMFLTPIDLLLKDSPFHVTDSFLS